MSNAEKKRLLAELMLIWGRTIEEHRIGDFETWLAMQSAAKLAA